MRTRFRFRWGVGLLTSLFVGLPMGGSALGEGEGADEESPPPTVTLHVVDRTATEQNPFIDSIPDTAIVTFQRTGSFEDSLVVYYQVGGSATPGLDYPELPGEIVIPAGAGGVRLEIEALDDGLVEPDETILLGLIIPPGLPDVPPPYDVGLPAEGMVWILDDDGRQDPSSPVAIVTPPDGAILPVPEELLIVASSKDPLDLVLSVEFFVNGDSLGVVEATTVFPVSPRDGSLPDWASIAWFRILWENPTPGVHEIVALAKDFKGVTTRSEPVVITLLEGSPVPVVTVEATDAEGAEVGFNSDGNAELNPAVFTLHRTGPTERPLTVRIRLSGTAENGVDYDKVPSEVVFPEGAARVDVVIRPVDDELPERMEHVVLGLVAPPPIEIWPPPEGLYWVGRPGEAKVVILDNDEADNLPPVVDLWYPITGEIFRAPAAIQLIAMAGDRDGEVVQVEFFAGDRRIGEGQPNADAPHLYRLLWEEVPAGDYAIRAVATDNKGATQESGTATIKVVELHRPPVVTVETIDGEASEIPEGSLRPEDPAVFRVHRTGGSDAKLTVYYHMRGSADNGVDYHELPGKVTFGEGEESVDVYVSVLPDELEEGPETVVIALMPLPCLVCLDPAEGPVELDRWPSQYLVGEPSMARAVILDDDAVANRPPRVAITQPENGAVFKGPQNIDVVVAARDDDGWVSTVGLYAGDELIDEMTIVFIRAPEPGQDQTFEFVWEDVRPGAYTLRAKAVDNQGAESWSGPVHIWVCPVEWPTVVSVVAVDPRAIEPGPDGEADPGTFAVYRRGDLSIPLTVYYAVGGTARNGEDYELLTGELTISAGHEAARIQVLPAYDTLPEDTETVVVELEEPPCITIYPPPPECYRVGELRRAVVNILDRSEEPNRPPRIELVRPHEGDVFQLPEEIKMVAAACDRDGLVTKVEFFTDGVKIHEWVADATLNLQPADVEACGYSYLWTEATVGEHVLYVVATDNEGASAKSQEVTIKVIGDSRPPLVRIVATDPYAAERPEDLLPDTATFKVYRTGSTDEELMVWYSIGGMATPGEDYAKPTRPVVIPAGRRTARVVIDPISDDKIERVETVVLRLEPSPTLGPIEPYHIGWPAKACAVIVDHDHQMRAVQPLPEDGFHLCLPGERGMPYRIEASEDMVRWIPVRDSLADEDGFVRFSEPEMRQVRHRFYRIRSVVMDALTLGDE